MKNILCFFLLFIGAIKSTPAQKVIFADNFADNHNKWATNISDSNSYLVHEGKFVMETYDSANNIITLPVPIDTNKNYSISVTVMHTGGTNNSGFGICFGSSDVNNYYSFCIASGGFYRLDRYVANVYTTPVNWTTSTAVKSGSYVENKLKLAKEGSSWKLYINGQLVNTVPAMPFVGNQIGFVKYNNQRIEFSDLKVTQ